MRLPVEATPYSRQVTEVTIPTYVDMLLPTLQALDELGGAATRGEVDSKTVEVMRLTSEQMAMVFPLDARQKGSKVVHRLAWARTYLKKFGAIDNSRVGVWTLEERGRTYLAMDPADAATTLRHAHAEAKRPPHAGPVAAPATASPKSVDVLGRPGDRDLNLADVPPPSRHARTTLSRRTVLTACLAGIGGVALAAAAASRLTASPRRRLTPSIAPTTTPPTVPPTIATPPTVPVSAPALRVHDLYPDAPANAIALTIDDGPDPAWTPTVLDELAANGVAATFSMIGKWVVAYPDLARRVAAADHAICNHSMTHRIPFTSLSPGQIEAEVGGTSTAILQASGSPPGVFRSPGGTWSPTVLASVAGHGMRPIDWDVDPQDWQRPGTSVILARLLAAKPGDIVLCHDGGGDRSETVAALRTAIPALKSRGLVLVTL